MCVRGCVMRARTFERDRERERERERGERKKKKKKRKEKKERYWKLAILIETSSGGQPAWGDIGPRGQRYGGLRNIEAWEQRYGPSSNSYTVISVSLG